LIAQFKYIPLFLFTSLIASCQTPVQEKKLIQEIIIEDNLSNASNYTSLQIDTTSYLYSWKTNYDYNKALINVIDVPNGYERITSDKTSFSSWLQHLPINSDNTVYLHNGENKYNQNAQFKVLDIDVGNKDLQQCADAVMRLRAEYLYSTNQFNKIHFKYTNGTNIPFTKWSNGYYPSLNGNKVVWVSSSNNSSYKSFKKYLINIFMYAGTASLEKELKSIPLAQIQAGDVFIKGGFPGHAVIVVEVVTNEKTNDKAFILAQSYMPAQSIHILKNPNSTNTSPWYSLNEIDAVIETPEWTFDSSQLKRFVK